METTTQQTITIGSKVAHIRKGWTATVTNIYMAPGYGILHASLKFDVGTSVCALDCLRVAE